jgi:hypothetical protein
VLGRGCYCIWGASYVSWVFVGGLPFLWVLLGFLWFWGASFASWVFVGGLSLFICVFGAFLCLLAFLCFCGLAGLFLCILPVYLRRFTLFFNKIFLLIKKKKGNID